MMEGFLELRIRPWIRQLLTRSLAIAPAVIVILVAGDSSSYKLLLWTQVTRRRKGQRERGSDIVLQVILSMQLPFAVVPLLKVAGSQLIMGKYKLPLVVRMYNEREKCCASHCMIIVNHASRVIQMSIPGWLAAALAITFNCCTFSL